MTAGQAFYLRRELRRAPRGRAATLPAVAQMLAGGGALGVVSYGVWWVLDSALGRSIARPDRLGRRWRAVAGSSSTRRPCSRCGSPRRGSSSGSSPDGCAGAGA